MGKPPSRVATTTAVAWKRLSDISTAAWLWSFLPSGALSVIAGWRASVAGLPDWAALLIALGVMALVIVILAGWRVWRALPAPSAVANSGTRAAQFHDAILALRHIANARELWWADRNRKPGQPSPLGSRPLEIINQIRAFFPPEAPGDHKEDQVSRLWVAAMTYGRTLGYGHGETEQLRKRREAFELELQSTIKLFEEQNAAPKAEVDRLYQEELARLQAVERAKKAMLVQRAIGGSLGGALEELEKDQKAEAEARRQRMIREASEPPRPRADAWMPLHSALRYLVYESEWGHQQARPVSRDEFDRLVSLEIRERLARGELRARGAKGGAFSNPDQPTEEIPTSYWVHGFIQPHGEIVMADPNRAAAGNPTGCDTYRRVILSSDDMARIWPSGRDAALSPLASFVEPARVEFEASKAAERVEARKRRQELIAKGRDVVLRFRQAGEHQGFEEFASKDRDYLDIQPHLGDEYQAERSRNARRATATADGSDYRAAMLLRELARLEKEWGLI